MTADYFANPAMSASVIKAGRLSMQHMRHAHTTQSETTPSMRWGKLVHAIVLEPEEFSRNVRVFEGDSKRGNVWKAFQADNDPEWIVTIPEHADLLAMSKAVLLDHEAANILRDIEDTEIPLFWDDDELGPCKCKMDGYGKLCGRVEFKTTSKIAPRQFAAQAESLGYFHGAGWYHHGAEVCGLGGSKRFNMIVMESSEPYAVCVYEIPEPILNECYRECVKIVKEYRQAEKVNRFFGPTRERQMLERPAWATQQQPMELTIGGEKVEV